MLVEVMNGDRTCGPNEVGELVITELDNIAMPLIRYRTGDFGSIAASPCRCGRGLRVLEGIHGRAYDFIRNRAGESFHGEFMIYLFEDLQRRERGVRQFQIIQSTIDSFHVRIVPDGELPWRAREQSNA